MRLTPNRQGPTPREAQLTLQFTWTVMPGAVQGMSAQPEALTTPGVDKEFLFQKAGAPESCVSAQF